MDIGNILEGKARCRHYKDKKLRDSGLRQGGNANQSTLVSLTLFGGFSMKDEMYVAFPSTITYIFGINTCTLALFPTVYYMSNIWVNGSCDYVSRTISEYFLMNSAFIKIQSRENIKIQQ